MNKVHDVVIVGAGPGGSSAAHFLARRGMDVLLLDKAEFPREKTCGDGLTPRALGVLREMNLLSEIERLGHRINGIELFSHKGGGLRLPVPEVEGLPNKLVILPRLILDERILKRAISSGAEFASGVRVSAIEDHTHRVVISGLHEKKQVQFSGKILIIATGANMRLLMTLGFLKRPPAMLKAARAYFEGVSNINDYVQVHFDNVPLPGYGWVFPTSMNSANVGIGYWSRRGPLRRDPTSVRSAFDHFVQGSHLRQILANAEMVGPVKGFPIRVDFPHGQTSGDKILLVGEAAGLVSPLTGEGIDFALHSGKLAAEHIWSMFERADFSKKAYSAYDRLLIEHYHHLFRYLNRIRKLYINPLLVDRFIRVAQRMPELRVLLVNILLGHSDAAQGVTARTIQRVLFGR